MTMMMRFHLLISPLAPLFVVGRLCFNTCEYTRARCFSQPSQIPGLSRGVSGSCKMSSVYSHAAQVRHRRTDRQTDRQTEMRARQRSFYRVMLTKLHS